ncbi:MAG TPA: hypothetical protein VER33_19245, partial [Polyangiaceae bacterium]|nr:hypothetical protein [Polyangiaceae bacterium]
LLLSLPGCGAAPEGELEEVASDGEALTLNNDPEQLIVYSQNLAQFGTRGVASSTQVATFHWQNVVRCIKDPTCNGFDAVPDLFILQEISAAQCEQFDNYLEQQLSNGANTWDYQPMENYRAESWHWMSGCILHRRARFESSSRQHKAIRQKNGDGSSCTETKATYMGNLALKDLARVNAGYTTRQWVSIANRHDDHFGQAKDTCDNSTFKADGVHVDEWDPDTSFCVYQNSKVLKEQMATASLLIMAGDYNYEPKHCAAHQLPSRARRNGDPWPNDYYRCHYKAITAGLGNCAGATFEWPNLGWVDVIGSLSPASYNDHKWDIDYIHTMYSAGATLMPPTLKNYSPGRIAKGFYTVLPTPYVGEDAYYPKDSYLFPSERMSDHDGLLVKIRY